MWYCQSDLAPSTSPSQSFLFLLFSLSRSIGRQHETAAVAATAATTTGRHLPVPKTCERRWPIPTRPPSRVCRLLAGLDKVARTPDTRRVEWKDQVGKLSRHATDASKGVAFF